jgi:hypothetical protein
VEGTGRCETITGTSSAITDAASAIQAVSAVLEVGTTEFRNASMFIHFAMEHCCDLGLEAISRATVAMEKAAGVIGEACEAIKDTAGCIEDDARFLESTSDSFYKIYINSNLPS